MFSLSHALDRQVCNPYFVIFLGVLGQCEAASVLTIKVFTIFTGVFPDCLPPPTILGAFGFFLTFFRWAGIFCYDVDVFGTCGLWTGNSKGGLSFFHSSCFWGSQLSGGFQLASRLAFSPTVGVAFGSTTHVAKHLKEPTIYFVGSVFLSSISSLTEPPEFFFHLPFFQGNFFEGSLLWQEHTTMRKWLIPFWMGGYYKYIWVSGHSPQWSRSRGHGKLRGFHIRFSTTHKT